MGHSERNDRIMCVSMGHEDVPAVRLVSCEGENGYPYCQECARTLVCGGEIDRGAVPDYSKPALTDAERLLAGEALAAAEGNLLLRKQEIAGMLDLLGRVARHLRNLPASKQSEDIALAAECETWVEALGDD